MPPLQPLPAPTAEERLRDALRYDAHTGEFTWAKKISSKIVVGSVAGSHLNSGYNSIVVNKKRYLSHRLAWWFIHGYWPDCDVDHINQDKRDNRIENLRLATRSQNMINCGLKTNNTSGVRGVYWSKRKQRWIARIMKDRKHIWIGTFTDLASAEEAMKEGYKREFGDFAA